MAAHSRILPAIIALGFVLAGCASSGPTQHGAHYGPGRPHYTVAPYQINGVWYYPKVDYNYDQSGTASWYGPGFDHHATADGEIYDMNDLTAAHKTLPLPSVVAVTNMQNGRELRLRVNDRGPFVGDRLIDVSRRAAQLLGFDRAGVASVRVRVLKDESIEVAEAAMRGESGRIMVAAAPTVTHVAMAAVAPRPAPRPAPVQQIAVAPPPAPIVVNSPAPQPAPVAEPLPPAPMAAPSQSPPPAVVATHRPWPSLIATAHAETLRPVAAYAARPGRIFVQAGAFAVPENAQKVRVRIAALGSAEVVPATVNGAALYRVRLGPLASEVEARRLLTRVVDSGYPGAHLVAE